MQAHGGKGTRVPDPLEIPRPYTKTKPEPRPQSSKEELVAFFGGAVKKG